MQILDGRIIYSPNSTRTVQIPSRLPDTQNPFFPSSVPGTTKLNYWKLDASVYERPQWYHIKFGWVCFYDKNVLSSPWAPLINTLRYSSSQFVFDETYRYTASSSLQDDWLRLENQLNRAFQAILYHYPVQAFSPCRPYLFGYLCAHQNRNLLSLALQKSKAWFQLWMAILSFVIAAAECTRSHAQVLPSLLQPRWQDLILEYGEDLDMDCVWLDMLLDTPIVNFSPDVSRTGTFIMLDQVDVVDTSPSVDWFMEYGVPVWYEYGSAQASRVQNERFAPLVYQLQEGTGFRTKSPSPPTMDQPFDHLSSGGGSGSPLTSLAPTPEDQDLPDVHSFRNEYSTSYMDDFFEVRAQRISRILEHETAPQRQSRLSRAAQPPTKNARVFEWTPSTSGEYTYEEIPKRLRQETLDYYSSEQSRYDPVLNEWHCCDRWGDFDDDDDEDFNFLFEGDHRPVADAVAPPNSKIPFDDAPVEELLLPNPDNALQQPVNIRLLGLQNEIVTIANLYFGYTPQIPLPSVPVLEDEKQRKSFCRSFGLIWDQVKTVEAVFTYPSVATAINFFLRLATKDSALKDDEWDLSSKNPFPVFASPRFRQFRLLQTKGDHGLQNKDVTIYMLDLGSKSVAPWKLAVKSALNALLICRLNPDFNEYDMVEFLLTHGISFHTLQPSNTVKQTPDVHRPCLLPLRRPPGYQFEARDYLGYRQRCHNILNHPRGRAALMHGHFMWRLAIRSVRFEAVCKGPSGWSSNPDEMLIVGDPSTGTKYLDDKLSVDEQEALCGTYHCFTGP